MKIKLSSVLVNDQDQALKFYTEVSGFVKKSDLLAGKYKWFLQLIAISIFPKK